MPLHFTKPGEATTAKPKLAVFGTFIDAPVIGELRIRNDTYIIVDVRTGKIESISAAPQLAYDSADVEVVDIAQRGAVIPGFIDCHVHAPQYKQLGTKTDVPLMEWLNKYTFPAEAAFSSPAHATRAYTRVVRRLLRNGTTTALYFGSNHLEASLILAETCGKYGQRALVGKTCSDQLVPDYYVETTAGSLRDTEEFILAVRKRFGTTEAALVKPVITPRFVPTCSRELLHGLGELAQKYDCHIQTHAAESVDQVALVRSQYPDLRRDIKILTNYGLLTPKTVLAHCTHLHDSEVSTLAKVGTSVASCPCSNMLFSRAILPVNRFRQLGLQIGLGTDIAGGHSASMVDSMRMAGLVSRIEGFRPPADRTTDPHDDEESSAVGGDQEVVNYKTAFHMATRGGALALRLDSVGAFEVGMQWDAVEVDLTWDEDDVEVVEEQGEDEGEPDVEMKFEKWVCSHGGEQSVRNVWINGKIVFSRTLEV